MPNTPKGLTYPSNSSPVAVPADIQELATDVDGLIVPNTGGTYTGSVSFTQPPSVPTPTSGLHAVNKTYADAINADVTALETELGTNPSGTFSTVVQRLDSYTDGFDNVGNLYTYNQATGQEPEWSGTDTYGTVTHPDSVSIQFTHPASNPSNRMSRRPSYMPATPGKTYTFTAEVSAVSGGYAQMVASFRDGPAGSTLLDLPSKTFTSPGTITVVGTAPANTTGVYIWHNLEGSSTGSSVTYTKMGYWEGAGGVWSLPGTPIAGQSSVSYNKAVHLSGTGIPEGSIRAPIGSTYLQVDATNDVKGWIKWIKATGTSTTGWIAGPEADTGWRDISSMLLNGWTINAADGCLQIRRVGSVVTLRAHVYNGTLDASIYTSSSGFTPSKNAYFPVTNYYNGSAIGGSYWPSSGALKRYTSNSPAYQTISVITSDSWPTSLPGTAV